MAQTKVEHLAIILDGNRRWASQHKLPIYRGHQAGVRALERIVKACFKRGIKYLTVYTLSTENWQRTKGEIKALMKIMEQAINHYTDLLDREQVRLRVVGRVKDFPKSLQSSLDRAVHRLRHYRRGILTLAMSYGGRDELVRAAEKAKRAGGKLDEETFAKFLDTTGLPDPDLIIRTGDRMRLSNFLLWQSAYSELYFTRTLWPDFKTRHLDSALKSFVKRRRNFGR